MKFVEQKYSWCDSTYTAIEFDEGVEGLAQLAELAAWLKANDEDDENHELVREWAADLAEDLEVPFTYTDVDGRSQTYTPASMWEASGGCEWEESAQDGDYGWNI